MADAHAEDEAVLRAADTERAVALYHEGRTEAQGIAARFRAALHSGDPEQLYAFMAENGYRLGNGLEDGHGERLVLEEALRDVTLPLEMVGLFFRRLGGRFMVSQRFDVCVFSMLIHIDNDRWVQRHDPRNAGLPTDDAAVERWAARTAEIVRYLVEDVRMPIRMLHTYRTLPFPGTQHAPLMTLARQANAWATYCALGQYLYDDQDIRRVAPGRLHAEDEAVLRAADTERAVALYHEGRTEAPGIAARFRAALHSGDPDQLYTFMAENGYRLGNGVEDGHGERLVLEEALRDVTLPLEMVGLFFRRLGGRFMVSQRFDVCVFSMLIQIDNDRWVQWHDPRNAGLPTDDAAVERWAARTAEIVRYLVEDVRMPIRMLHTYRTLPFPGTQHAPLMTLARQANAWATYCALGQYLYDDQDQNQAEEELIRLVLARPSPTMGVWARRLGIETLSDDAFSNLLVAHDRLLTTNPQAHALLTAEVARRAAERVHMRALLMLPSHDPSNAPARNVFEDPYLAQHIHAQAWEDAEY